MGIGLFAPPLGLGLYGARLIGGVKLEETVRPILKYLGVLFLFTENVRGRLRLGLVDDGVRDEVIDLQLLVVI